MDDVIQILTTTGDQQTATTIARDLVENRLAACVQMGGPITSVYRWQERVETATEWTCLIKTVRSRYAAVESRVRQLHSYAEPEIVVVDLVDGSPTYLAWLRAQVTVASP
jgi:periplasmic divalent cation tolerance protein